VGIACQGECQFRRRVHHLVQATMKQIWKCEEACDEACGQGLRDKGGLGYLHIDEMNG